LSAAVVVLLIGAGLATATVHRNEVFKNPIAIWNDVIRKYPGHFRAHVSLGMSLAERHEYPEAIREYRAANEIDRYNAALHYYTGNALRDMGKVRDAIDEFREARRIAGGDLHIALNLGNAWASLGEMDKAIEVYRAGLAQAEPSTDKTIIAQAHFNLANTLGRETKNAEAEREYRAAIEANPTYAKAYYGLGLILEQLGRREEALEDLYTALRLNPNYYEAEAAVKDILRKKSIGE
jgi:tetratricopeptide (TPR) repeat protein